MKYKSKYISLKNIQIGSNKIIIHISGPSGSGKTTLGNKLKNKFGKNIIVKDIDDLRLDFIKKYYGDKKWTIIDKDAYQEYIDKYINKQKKPIIFVGLNNMPWWHKDYYYNMHSSYNYYIELDNEAIIKQKCLRWFKDISNDIIAMNDLLNDNKKFIKLLKQGLDSECNAEEIIKMNNEWNKCYKNQGYKFMSRENIYKQVSKLLDKIIYSKINSKQIGKGNNKNIIILHNPTIFDKPVIPTDFEPIIKKLKKYGNVHNYFFKFSYYGNKFKLSDIEFDNVADDINTTFKNLDKFIIVAINHASPFGLYFVNKYPEKCQAIICYPFRFYNITSYERRIWKMKHNQGFEKLVKNKKYNIDDHLINIDEKNFSKLFDNIGNDEKQLIYLTLDFYLQKNSNLIPTVFKIPTYLYTRLDLDIQSIIKYNYERKEIAEMKQIVSKDDALLNSMIWNFDRIKFDAELKKKNIDNNNLHIKYLITGWEDFKDIIDNVVIIKNYQ